MIYKNIKRLIERDSFDREDLSKKIDMFYLFNRITEEEYKNLMNLLGIERDI